jgi:hypothetical protein
MTTNTENNKIVILKSKKTRSPYFIFISNIKKKIYQDNPNITSEEYEKEFVKEIIRLENIQNFKHKAD